MFFPLANISDIHINRYAHSRHKYIHFSQIQIVYIFGESVYNLLPLKNGIRAIMVYIKR